MKHYDIYVNLTDQLAKNRSFQLYDMILSGLHKTFIRYPVCSQKPSLHNLNLFLADNKNAN